MKAFEGRRILPPPSFFVHMPEVGGIKAVSSLVTCASKKTIRQSINDSAPQTLSFLGSLFVNVTERHVYGDE
jgi:hypothetical protein